VQLTEVGRRPGWAAPENRKGGRPRGPLSGSAVRSGAPAAAGEEEGGGTRGDDGDGRGDQADEAGAGDGQALVGRGTAGFGVLGPGGGGGGGVRVAGRRRGPAVAGLLLLLLVGLLVVVAVAGGRSLGAAQFDLGGEGDVVQGVVELRNLLHLRHHLLLDLQELLELLLKIAWHETWHTGQLAAARRALGLPPAHISG